MLMLIYAYALVEISLKSLISLTSLGLVEYLRVTLKLT